MCDYQISKSGVEPLNSLQAAGVNGQKGGPFLKTPFFYHIENAKEHLARVNGIQRDVEFLSKVVDKIDQFGPKFCIATKMVARFNRPILEGNSIIFKKGSHLGFQKTAL